MGTRGEKGGSCKEEIGLKRRRNRSSGYSGGFWSEARKFSRSFQEVGERLSFGVTDDRSGVVSWREAHVRRTATPSVISYHIFAKTLFIQIRNKIESQYIYI